jgi:very-short-patch-repair endonuclease
LGGLFIPISLLKEIWEINMQRQKFIPYNRNLKERAREMRNNPTLAEKIFWYEILRNKNFFEYSFLRQKPLLNYIIDFYCSKLLIAIEIDGESHLTNEEYDKNRSTDLKKYGIKVIRYYNNEIIEGLDGVSEDLKTKIKQREIEILKQ